MAVLVGFVRSHFVELDIAKGDGSYDEKCQELNGGLGYWVFCWSFGFLQNEV